jgi:putative DNA primase/helicase
VKGLPSSLETERLVLGCLLNGADFGALGLGVADFTAERNRLAFSAIAEVHRRGLAVDHATVAEHLRQTGKLEVGDLGWLVDLSNGTPQLPHPESYAKTLRDLSARRALWVKAQKLADHSLLPESTLETLGAEAAALSILNGASPVLRNADVDTDWSEPLPIGSELPPVQPFEPEMLPGPLRAFVEDISDRMQVPLDYPAACLMVAMAGAINRRGRIQPKAGDSSWVVIPNLWGGIIAPPGFLKSPVLQAITAPLYVQEALWRMQHETDMEDFVAQKEELDLRVAAWREQTKANFKKGPHLVTPGSQPLRPDTSIKPPTLKRLITCDSTFEKLHELMQENPAGLLVIRDELTGWLSELDREGRQGERGFFLSAWNGDTPFTIDRIVRGSVQVAACCVSVLGGITPGRLRSYLIDALQDGPSNDGLIQRFQILVWPDPPRAWRYVDRAPSKNQIVTQMFERIFRWDSDLPAEFRFNAEAQEFFRNWLGDLEHKIRGDELHPALISHLGKYRKLMPALALLLATADQLLTEGQLYDPPVVFLDSAKQAARWCTYLESHARRIYAAVVTPVMQAAADLAARLKAKAAGADGVFAVRDVYRHCWSRLDTPERVTAALGVLEDAGWVRAVKNDSRPGRPPNLYFVNPRLHQDREPK